MQPSGCDEKGVLGPCPNCGAVNRLRYAALNQQNRCGRCKTNLPPVSAAVEIDSAADFEKLLLECPLPVLTDFWAAWCGPCKMMAPELDKVAQRRAGALLVAKVDTDALPALAQAYAIQSLPTLVLFVGGKEVNRALGAQPASRIEAFAETAGAVHP